VREPPGSQIQPVRENDHRASRTRGLVPAYPGRLTEQIVPFQASSPYYHVPPLAGAYHTARPA
jgi:hypothetical protein